MTIPAPHPDTASAERAAALVALGLHGPEADLDVFASRLADDAGAPYAMINIFGSEQQFLGLHTPAGAGLEVVGRSMPLDHGYCPEVVGRALPLVLPDVFASPRFASNPVVDLIGIRTYAGAPLLHQGTVIGTVCFVGTEARDRATGRPSLDLVKQRADEVMRYLHQRAGLPH